MSLRRKDSPGTEVSGDGAIRPLPATPVDEVRENPIISQNIRRFRCSRFSGTASCASRHIRRPNSKTSVGASDRSLYWWWCRRRCIPYSCLTSREAKDNISSAEYRENGVQTFDRESIKEDVGRGGLERVHEGQRYQLCPYHTLLGRAVWELQHLQESKLGNNHGLGPDRSLSFYGDLLRQHLTHRSLPNHHPALI